MIRESFRNMSQTTSIRDQGRPVVPSQSALRPLGLYDVTITDGFWADKQKINGEASIEHCEAWIEKIGWIGNFDAAIAGTLPEAHTGRSFADSDVYKLIEAMAWEIARTNNTAMERRLNALVERIAPVQEPDGYLNTFFGRPGQQPRYSDLEWGHELYCYGHLIQAAIARGRTRGEDLLVAIARRAADHVCEVFGPDGLNGICGHPEIEVALAEFARYTGDRKYLDQAALFIERRGHGLLGEIEHGASYFQDDIPVRETTVMSGHSVRALYLASAAIDVAVDTDDAELLSALITQTANTVARRTYITGGMGARHSGESFGLDFELPSDRAYSETCAGVGSVMVNYRLLLATGDPQYADLIERTLFNVVAASPAADGRAFFYTNTLHQREHGVAPLQDKASPRAASSQRAPWFEVSCCPTNVARTISSLGAYVATTDGSGVQIHQYTSSRIRTQLDSGAPIELLISTDYPASGSIRIEVLESPDSEWTLALRVPSWNDSAVLTVDNVSAPVAAGVAKVSKVFAVGEVVALELSVAPRLTFPDPRIDAIRNSIAVEQGPLVMCLESVDLAENTNLDEVTILAAPPTRQRDRTTISARVQRDPAPAWPYSQSPLVSEGASAEEIRLIPYHEWANRGASTMRVWLPLDAPESKR
jgi:DUF1680 family protein